MPVAPRTEGGGKQPLYPTHTFSARAVNSSEAIALHGEKALTPIIAGTISGTCIGVAWLVALIVIIVKRYRRKQYYKKIGKPSHEGPSLSQGEEYIVPPDPAVIAGKHQPGDRVIVVRKKRWWRRLFRWDKKKGGATETRAMKGKEREAEVHMMKEVSGREKEEQNGKGRLIQARQELDESQHNQHLTDPHPPHRPPHLQHNRLDTIMSIPEAADQESSAQLQREIVKKTDFAIGSDDAPSSSGSSSEPALKQHSLINAR